MEDESGEVAKGGQTIGEKNISLDTNRGINELVREA